MSAGTLYIVATPIGNLEDVTLRSLRILSEADMVYAEDTRVTKKLLMRHSIDTPLRRYDEHVANRAHSAITSLLADGKNVALASDAGTPGIADPGARLVAYVRRELPQVPVVPIPGPSALITALSVAGVSAEQFTFLGYPPHKKGRETFFKKLSYITVRPAVFYESPHRIARAFADLARVCGNGGSIVIARELTKVYEEVFAGTIAEAREHFLGKRQKGEFVIIVL